MNFSTIKKSTAKDTVNNFIQKNKHGLLMLYMFLYFPWFSFLEKTVTNNFHVIHMAVDDKIPFIEFFIVPYLLWFFYVAGAVLFYFFRNKDEYVKLCIFLFTGMTIFLIISTIYPNGQYLRPTTFVRDNIFVDMVQKLYATDTPTNLFPSIHVYNSIGVNFAIWHCDNFKERHKWVRGASSILMISIVLSTMFLKQHSMFDVITGIVLASFMYTLVYAKSSVGVANPGLEEMVRHV